MPDSGTARREAAHILSGPEFHAHPGRTFNPLGGVFRFIGRITSDVFSPVLRVLEIPFRALARYIGTTGALVLALAVLAVIVALVTTLIARRRSRIGDERAADSLARTAGNPEDLDRRAAEAERSGDLDRAVRLRFEAGLARLERRGLVSERATRTSGDLSASLGSPSFDRLASDLEAIVYAERPAVPDQVEASRALWPHVPEEAGRPR